MEKEGLAKKYYGPFDKRALIPLPNAGQTSDSVTGKRKNAYERARIATLGRALEELRQLLPGWVLFIIRDIIIIVGSLAYFIRAQIEERWSKLEILTRAIEYIQLLAGAS